MIELFIGDSYQKVDTENIRAANIKYSVKDISNYGKRNISFTKPINVIRNSNSDKIFKSLFNLNSTDGYDTSKTAKAKLVEDGIVILNGIVQVINIAKNYYEVVVTSPQFNLFNEMGDSLIRGNEVADNDITFDNDYYEFNYTRDAIRAQFNEDPSTITLGEGYRYVAIDFDNTINNAADISSDYPIMPAIAAKELWNAIFEKYGYTYTLSDDISYYLNKMYIPFNDDYTKYADTWEYSKYLLGEYEYWVTYSYNDVPIPTLPSGYLEANRQGLPVAGPLNRPSTSTYGSILGSYIYNPVIDASAIPTVTAGHGGYDEMVDPSTSEHQYKVTAYNYIAPKNGKYSIETNLLASKAYEYADTGLPIPMAVPLLTVDTDIEMIITRVAVNSENESISLGTITSESIEAESPYIVEFNNIQENIYLYKGDKISIVAKSTEIDTTSEISKRIAILLDPSTYIKVGLNNSLLGTDRQWNLNDTRPIDYKQADFVDDIFKMFNCFVEIDDNDPTSISIKSYAAYYENCSTLDWTNKLDQDDITFRPIKNEFSKQTNFKRTEGEDIYNEDYTYRYNNSFGNKQVLNDSEFSSGSTDISLTSASTVIGYVDDTIIAVGVEGGSATVTSN